MKVQPDESATPHPPHGLGVQKKKSHTAEQGHYDDFISSLKSKAIENLVYAFKSTTATPILLSSCSHLPVDHP